jgi:pimeloyl-ACP methyl ester carboxylesterase
VRVNALCQSAWSVAILLLPYCFRLDRPEAERLADMKFAFFAPGHDASIWRGGWYPEAATAQIAATPRDAGRGLVERGLEHAPAGDPGAAGPPTSWIAAPMENGRMMKAELGDRVELLEIDGAGHALLPEQPEKIAAAIIAFARRNRGIW